MDRKIFPELEAADCSLPLHLPPMESSVILPVILYALVGPAGVEVTRRFVVRSPPTRARPLVSTIDAPPHPPTPLLLNHHHSYPRRYRQPRRCRGGGGVRQGQGRTGSGTAAANSRLCPLSPRVSPRPPPPAPAPCPRVARAAAPTERRSLCVSDLRSCANPGVSRACFAASHEALACVPRGGHAEAH